MKYALLSLIVVLSASYSGLVTAYKEPTHVKLSEVAASASLLTQQPSVLQNLGLKSSDKFKNSKNKDRTILELIQDGAEIEDADTTSRNHFYDPKYDRPLTLFGTYLGARSSDWALEDQAVSTGQDFSFHDVRRYFYKALTLPTEQDRSTYFGRTFEGLGHIIHHLQDMAQPQHVRNDIHLDRYSLFGLNPLYNPSRYEEFTNKNRATLPFDSGAIQFSNPRAFWINDSDTGLAQFTNRSFVSAGTNFRMFDGQVVANSTYPNPQPTGGESSIDIQQLFSNERLPAPRDQDGNLLHGDITFIGSYVDGVLNSRASTLSIFDQDLTTYNKTVTYDADPLDPDFNYQVTVDRLFTLNQFNFRSAYPFLIPKAVGYSAGLIDYFFRGNLELAIEEDFDSPGQYLIKNKTNEPLMGLFTIYGDDIADKRLPLPADWNDLVIPAQGQSTPLLAPTQNPALTPDPNKKNTLVFRGTLGEEKPRNDNDLGAVIGKQVKLLWEPWSRSLTDNHPWSALSGTVDDEVGPNSQSARNGRLVLSVGAGGAGGVIWQAQKPEEALPLGYMRMRLKSNTNPYNVDIYGWICFGTGRMIGGIPFCDVNISEIVGLAAVDSPIGMAAYPAPTEYIFNTGALSHVGPKIVYVEIWLIGFEQGVDVEIDYLDFSEKPFDDPLPNAIFIPG